MIEEANLFINDHVFRPTYTDPIDVEYALFINNSPDLITHTDPIEVTPPCFFNFSPDLSAKQFEQWEKRDSLEAFVERITTNPAYKAYLLFKYQCGHIRPTGLLYPQLSMLSETCQQCKVLCEHKIISNKITKDLPKTRLREFYYYCRDIPEENPEIKMDLEWGLHWSGEDEFCPRQFQWIWNTPHPDGFEEWELQAIEAHKIKLQHTKYSILL